MKKLCGMLAVAAMFAISACGGMPGSGDGGNGGGAPDMSQGDIDNAKNNGVAYWVTVHANPQPGQCWEWTTKMAGMEQTSGWQCCKREGDVVWLEELRTSGAVIAYQVDLTKTDKKVNVTAAWVGKKGAAPETCKVMAYVEPTAGTGEAPKTTTTTEDGTINLAGKDWACTITTTKGEGWESKMWTAKDGWFNDWLKMESGSAYVMELTKSVADAKPWLDWAAAAK